MEPDTTIPPSPAMTLPSIETLQDFDWNLNTSNVGGGNGAGPPSDSEPYLIELYPGATEIFGCGQQAHPLLISLTNLDMEFHMKASNHAFLLLVLLPIPWFIASQQAVE